MADTIRSKATALLPLTPAAFHVLAALADRNRHGLGILRDIESRTGGRFSPGPGSLYGTIKRVLEAGLIEATEDRPAADSADPRRRYYRLTALGRQAARLEAQRLHLLVGIATDKQLLPDHD